MVKKRMIYEKIKDVEGAETYVNGEDLTTVRES